MVVLHDFFLISTPTTASFTLSLHDALPIFLIPARSMASRVSVTSTASSPEAGAGGVLGAAAGVAFCDDKASTLRFFARARSEEHTSELQSRRDLVCRLLLEKKN